MSEEEVAVVAHHIALEICEATAEQARAWTWPDDFTGDTIDRATCRARDAIAALDKHRAETALTDLMLHGAAISCGGKRIDPKDFYAPPERTSE